MISSLGRHRRRPRLGPALRGRGQGVGARDPPLRRSCRRCRSASPRSAGATARASSRRCRRSPLALARSPYEFALGFVFAAGWGLPAWWLAYLALLARPRAERRGRVVSDSAASCSGRPRRRALVDARASRSSPRRGLLRGLSRRGCARLRRASSRVRRCRPRAGSRRCAAPADGDVINGLVTALPFAMALELHPRARPQPLARRQDRRDLRPSRAALALRSRRRRCRGSRSPCSPAPPPGPSSAGFLGVLALALLGGAHRRLRSARARLHP